MSSTSPSGLPAKDLKRALDAVHTLLVAEVHARCEGVLREALLFHLQQPGKQLRAQLVFSTCASYGVMPDAALHWAAAVECLHNATLIHDDLQDGDTTRRGQPSVWAKFGMEQAINAGDFLLVLPHMLVDASDAPVEVKGQLHAELARRSLRTVSGQSLEQSLLSHGHFTQDVYDRAARGKTGMFFALPVLGACILAGVKRSQVNLAGELFIRVGLWFQKVDDLLDLLPHVQNAKGAGRTGSDLKEGRVSAVVVRHLQRGLGDEDDLKTFLRSSRESCDDEDVDVWRTRFHNSGTLDILEMELREDAVRLCDQASEVVTPLLPVVCGIVDRVLRGLSPAPTSTVVHLPLSAAAQGGQS